MLRLGTMMPVCSCTTTSGSPPLQRASTGRPAAGRFEGHEGEASSHTEGTTTMSTAARTSAIRSDGRQTGPLIKAQLAYERLAPHPVRTVPDHEQHRIATVRPHRRQSPESSRPDPSAPHRGVRRARSPEWCPRARTHHECAPGPQEAAKRTGRCPKQFRTRSVRRDTELWDRPSSHRL